MFSNVGANIWTRYKCIGVGGKGHSHCESGLVSLATADKMEVVWHTYLKGVMIFLDQ